MSSKARSKALAEDTEDEDVAAMLQAQPQSNGDQTQWLRDKYGDLDWAYTARVVRKWNHDALLTHIWEKSFSIPAREYNPSAPFVYVKMHDGEVVTLPHGYRLPLMFVAKYYWGIALSKLKNVELWKKERANVFHLLRLCENLFQRARAKAFAGGMEKGWRCLMFDRLLARFYKGWYRNDPPSGKEFVTTFGAKEYDRDVLKHDWKRWCTRGLNGVKMKESEVMDGITVAQFREGLSKGEDGKWTLNGEPLPFTTIQEDLGWSSISELTECDMDTEEGSEANSEGDGSSDDDDLTSRDGKLPEATASPEKRARPLQIDEDDLERASKRARIEVSNNILLSPGRSMIPRPAAVAESSSGPGSESRPHIINSSPPPESSTSSRLSNQHLTKPLFPSGQKENNSLQRTIPRSTITNTPAQMTKDVDMSSSSSKKSEPPKSPDFVIVVPRPLPKPTLSRSLSSLSTHESSSRAGSSLSSKGKGRAIEEHSILSRPSGSKPRQTRASRIAGVATVNVYVSDGKPRGGAAKAGTRATAKPRPVGRNTSRSPSPSLSNLPSQHLPSRALPTPSRWSAPEAKSSVPAGSMVTSSTTMLPPEGQALVPPPTNPLPAIATPSINETQPALSRDVITAKALELLVNLVDSKQILSNAFNSSSTTSSSAADNRSDASQPTHGKHLAFEGRFQNLEERLSSVREELKNIIGRLQDLEKETSEQRALKTAGNERVFQDKNVECRPVMMTMGVETDRSDVQGLAMGNANESVAGRDAEGDVKMTHLVERVLGEMAVQTEEEESWHRSQQPDALPEDISKGEQTPTQEVALTAVEMRTTDRHCGSETDTDSTIHIVKDETIDPRAQEMSENLSLLVNNLVSAKMLSVVGDMLKGKGKDTTMVDLDTSLRSLSPVTTPSSDSFTLANLLDEFKALKEESRAREIREREEMQAMRQLHSAEVDALRRRLSYLESQSHDIDPGSAFSGRYRTSLSHSAHVIRDGADSEGLSERERHAQQPRHSYTTGRNPSPSGSGKGEIDRTSSLDSINSRLASAGPLPTPVHSERSFSFARPGHERDDELPLPIKSQRKQHMSFPRTTFS